MAVSRRGVMRSALALGMAGASPAILAERDAPVFRHGVASGEPGPDRVLLWTRLTGVGEARGQWRVASDSRMRRVVAQGEFTARADRDFTAKVVVGGLLPGRDYWYRFDVAGQRSPIGRTRTLATGRLDEFNLVSACCAMYMTGYFQAYREIARLEKLDAVLFLGDYIYEYGAAQVAASNLLRIPDPPHTAVSLDDYRRRFAQARTDPDLQAAHARAPWICIWDDHEIADDDWMGGAEGHDPATAGDWAARKAAAVRAWYEWLPVHDPDPAMPYAIGRAHSFGDLVALIVPESRLTARQHRLRLPNDMDMSDTPRGPQPDVAGFRRKLADPARTMIGADQVGWIGREMRRAKAARQPWVLLGSGTVMAYYDYPDLRRWAPASGPLGKFYEITAFGVPILNLDAWSGYLAERARLFDQMRGAGVRTVVLSGDSHMAWVNRLHDQHGPVALELSSTTLTGPALGDVLALRDTPFGRLVVAQNPEVLWCDPNAIGFIALRITRDAVDARFIMIADPRTPASRAYVAKHVVSARQPDGSDDWVDVPVAAGEA